MSEQARDDWSIVEPGRGDTFLIARAADVTEFPSLLPLIGVPRMPVLAAVPRREDAEQIVREHNAHDALVKACEDMTQKLVAMAYIEKFDRELDADAAPVPWTDDIRKEHVAMLAAITLATGEKEQTDG